jgi:hypothetical protein
MLGILPLSPILFICGEIFKVKKIQTEPLLGILV